MPVPIGFLRQPSAGRSMRAARAIRAFGNAYTATTELLNFASGLPRPFRIVWTVTILQQAVACFYGDGMARDDPEMLHTTKQSGITPAVACQRDEQKLALFPYLRARRN